MFGCMQRLAKQRCRERGSQRKTALSLAQSAFLLVIKFGMSEPIYQIMSSCGCDGNPLKMTSRKINPVGRAC